MNTSLPKNWDSGFHGDLQIAAGGTERPFLHNGSWVLRVYEPSTGKHYLYDYRTDLLSEETVAQAA